MLRCPQCQVAALLCSLAIGDRRDILITSVYAIIFILDQEGNGTEEYSFSNLPGNEIVLFAIFLSTSQVNKI